MADRCKATTKKGKPCGFPPQRGKDFCFTHDPEKGAERKEARRRAGTKTPLRKRIQAAKPAGTVEELRHLLAICIQDVRRGQLGGNEARAIARLGKVFLDSYSERFGVVPADGLGVMAPDDISEADTAELHRRLEEIRAARGAN